MLSKAFGQKLNPQLLKVRTNLKRKMDIIKKNKLRSSFRDPSGHVFSHNNKIFRTVSYQYKNNYDFFISSGLYKKLVSLNLLVPHKEIKNLHTKKNCKILSPKEIPFISYPYEWSFGEFRDAALLTLTIQKVAMEYGMSLKDASAYNVQFLDGRPVFIDTLSFEKYKKDSPWIAYHQYCEHFLGPIALMSHTDIRLSKLMETFLDGIPLDMTASLLPKKSYLKSALFLHIYLHSKVKSFSLKKADGHEKKVKSSFKNQMLLLESMEKYITNTGPKSENGKWSDYYEKLGYGGQSFTQKKTLVKDLVKLSAAKTVWDVGSNDGFFSRLIAGYVNLVVSSDSDPEVVEKNYCYTKSKKIKNILPLVIDVSNPSPAIGWENKERDSFLQRANFDCVLALALVHHLVINYNISFDLLAEMFSKVAKNVIIEFVGEKDERYNDLILKTKNIVSDYSRVNFEKAFLKFFKCVRAYKIRDSERHLYLFNKK